MARIAGINIPPHKHSEIGLTSIFGIGTAHARANLREACGIAYEKKLKTCRTQKLKKLREAVGVKSSKAICAAK